MLLEHDPQTNSRNAYFTWLGDSQAVLVKNGTPYDVTPPHKPELESERSRIENDGGTVMFVDTWRVNGTLAVSRAIGDPDYKPYVTSEPEIKKVPLTGEEDFVVLACDGLWDNLTPEEATTIVYEHLSTPSEEKSLTERAELVAELLVKRSADEGSCDNITAIVVFLKDLQKLIATPFSPPSPRERPVTTNGTTANGTTSDMNGNNDNHATNRSWTNHFNFSSAPYDQVVPAQVTNNVTNDLHVNDSDDEDGSSDDESDSNSVVIHDVKSESTQSTDSSEQVPVPDTGDALTQSAKEFEFTSEVTTTHCDSAFNGEGELIQQSTETEHVQITSTPAKPDFDFSTQPAGFNYESAFHGGTDFVTETNERLAEQVSQSTDDFYSPRGFSRDSAVTAVEVDLLGTPVNKPPQADSNIDMFDRQIETMQATEQANTRATKEYEFSSEIHFDSALNYGDDLLGMGTVKQPEQQPLSPAQPNDQSSSLLDDSNADADVVDRQIEPMQATEQVSSAQHTTKEYEFSSEIHFDSALSTLTYGNDWNGVVADKQPEPSPTEHKTLNGGDLPGLVVDKAEPFEPSPRAERTKSSSLLDELVQAQSQPVSPMEPAPVTAAAPPASPAVSAKPVVTEAIKKTTVAATSKTAATKTTAAAAAKKPSATVSPVARKAAPAASKAAEVTKKPAVSKTTTAAPRATTAAAKPAAAKPTTASAAATKPAVRAAPKPSVAAPRPAAAKTSTTTAAPRVASSAATARLAAPKQPAAALRTSGTSAPNLRPAAAKPAAANASMTTSRTSSSSVRTTASTTVRSKTLTATSSTTTTSRVNGTAAAKPAVPKVNGVAAKPAAAKPAPSAATTATTKVAPSAAAARVAAAREAAKKAQAEKLAAAKKPAAVSKPKAEAASK